MLFLRMQRLSLALFLGGIVSGGYAASDFLFLHLCVESEAYTDPSADIVAWKQQYLERAALASTSGEAWRFEVLD